MKIFTHLIVILFLSFFPLSKAAKNYINNPSFEILSNNKPTNWTDELKHCELVTDVVRIGKYSMHCKASSPGQGAQFYQVNKNLLYGVKYKATAYIKVKGISEGGYLIYFVESGDYKYGVYSYTSKMDVCKEGTCNDKWYKMEITSEVNFNQANYYEIGFDLRPKSKVQGEFWVDDVSLEIVEENILKSVLVKTYKSEVYKDVVDILVDLSIISSVFENGDYIKVYVLIEDYNDQKHVYQNLTDYKLENILDNRVAHFRWDPSKLPENKFFTIRAISVNSLFNNKKEEVITYAKKLNKTASYSFYIDEHNIAWKEGKKFFPIGFFFEDLVYEDLDYLIGSAFNVIKFPGASKETIEKIYAYTKGQISVINNIGVKYSSCTGTGTDTACLKTIRDQTITQINKVKDAKGLIGYYVADEPSINNLMALREITLTIREFDPDKFAWPALMRSDYMDRWKEMCDVGGLDCYPLQTYDDLEAIYIITDRARKLVMNSKPIWGIPQFFSWDYYYPDGPYGAPPTENQLRQMTYQFISAGANGLIYFALPIMKALNSKYPFDKEWAKIKKVTDELVKNYIPIILSSSSVNPGYKLPPFDNVNGDNYYGRRLWRYNGNDYLLIVNVRKQAYTAVFNKPSTTTKLEKMMGQADVIIEGDKVTLKMPAIDVVWLKGYDSDWKPKDNGSLLKFRTFYLIMMIVLLFF